MNDPSSEANHSAGGIVGSILVRFRLFPILFLIGLLQLPSTASGGRASSPQVEPRPAQPQALNGNQQTPISPPSGPPKNAQPPPEQPQRPPAAPAFSVVIDPAHGGTDPGARIAPNLLEKDLTLLLAKKLRQELQSRHIVTTLLRDNDAYLNFDQRAVAVNLARPSVFVTLHAEPSTTIRIYTAASNLAVAPEHDKNSFLPWDSAQLAFQGQSTILATTAVAAIEKRELSAVIRPSFLEPLHSIAAPSIAIEVPASRKGFKVSADLIAGALADAIAIRKMSGAAQ